MISAKVAPCQDAYNAGIALSPNERFIAAGNGKEVVALIRLSDGKVRHLSDQHVGLHGENFTKPCFSPDGQLLTAGSLAPDGGINPIWRVSDGRCIARVGIIAGPHSATPLSVVGFSKDGNFLFGGLYGTEFYIVDLAVFDTRTWRVSYYLRGNDSVQSSIAAVSAGACLTALWTDSRGLQFWDPIGKSDERWAGWPMRTPEGFSCLSFSGDGRKLVLAGDGWCAGLDPNQLPRTGVVYDGAKKIDNTYVLKKSEVKPNFRVRSLCVSHDGKSAFLGGLDGRILRFDLASGKCKTSWKAQSNPVKGLALTRNGRLLYVYDLSSIRCWDLQTMRLVRTFRS
ncbi:MAG: WD40 repeat domain-containing protein [Nitrospiraceae bacterium]